ncbi:MAG: phosphotransferase [Candidatus Adiutrix sp.]|jgi:aminoglycoside phosphotransferase (APT) family kinase protein|nr:phosphotransferase [Candidatus Adiutrix sp.]
MTAEAGSGRRVSGGESRQGDFRLLLAELTQHLDQVRLYLGEPSVKAREELRHKSAYISSLALVVHQQNFDLEREDKLDDDRRRFHRGLSAIAGRLPRIAELALNIVRQFGHLSQPSFLDDYDLDAFFDEIDLGLAMVRPALEHRKLKLVERLCRVEEALDARYADRFARLIREMEEGLGRPGDRVTALMIVHYLERIGDLILEIGEEILFIILGERLSYPQYQALEAGFKASGRGGRPAAAPGDFRSIWSGRSGCRIGVVRGGELGLAGAEERGFLGQEPVLFKHGPSAKLEKERENLEIWSRLWPGLPPAALAYVPAEGDGEAALVLEYIRGATLKDMFLQNPGAEALRELTGALHLAAGLWRETRLEEECRADFVRQGEKRLGPIQALYPDLVNFSAAVGDLEIKSFSALLKAARPYEAALPAPFTVRVHGDFNLSNIMRDEKNGSYRFIDLYRSRLSDYVQDLSVMILSILRLPLTGAAARLELSRAARLVYTFGLDFASQNHDPGLEARLAFGLARSFLTSARFEARRGTAARFLAHSRYLWEKILDYGRTGRPWTAFKPGLRVLYF